MPYITQERREGLRACIDTRTAKLRDSFNSHDSWHTGEVWNKVERDLKFLLTRGRDRDDIAPNHDLWEAASILRSREDFPESSRGIGGDLNFCLCRYLVGITQIHNSPRYESKIQWIDERLEGTRLDLVEDARWRFRMRDLLGILSCVGRELYRRYGAPYEDEKLKPVAEGGNGDIMD